MCGGLCISSAEAGRGRGTQSWPSVNFQSDDKICAVSCWCRTVDTRHDELPYFTTIDSDLVLLWTESIFNCKYFQWTGSCKGMLKESAKNIQGHKHDRQIIREAVMKTKPGQPH